MAGKYEHLIYGEHWPAEKQFPEKDRLIHMAMETDFGISMRSSTTWYHTASPNGKGQHTQDCPELLSWISGDPDNPHDLGGEMILYLNGEKKVIRNSYFQVAPAWMPHCPYLVTKVDRPMIHVAVPVSDNMFVEDMYDFPLHDDVETHYYDRFYTWDAEGDTKPAFPGEVRVLYADAKKIPAGKRLRVCWFKQDVPQGLIGEHKHDFDELLLFQGNDPKDPYNLHGEVTFTLGDEEYTITKTSYVAIPAGLAHGGFQIKNLTAPLFFCAFHNTEDYKELPAK